MVIFTGCAPTGSSEHQTAGHKAAPVGSEVIDSPATASVDEPCAPASSGVEVVTLYPLVAILTSGMFGFHTPMIFS